MTLTVPQTFSKTLMSPETPKSAQDAVPREQERVDMLDSKKDQRYEREGKNLLALSFPIVKGIDNLRLGAKDRKDKDPAGAEKLEASAQRIEEKLLILLHDIDSATVENILNQFSVLKSESGTNTDTASQKPQETSEEKQKRENEQTKLELKNRYDDISLSIKIRMHGAMNNIAESQKTLKQQWFFQRWGSNEKSGIEQSQKYYDQLQQLQAKINERYAMTSEKPELRSALLKSLEPKGEIAQELLKTSPDFAKLRTEFDRTMKACDIAEQGVQYAQTALEIAASYAGPPGIAAALIPKYIVELTTGGTTPDQLAWKIVEDIATAYIGGGKFAKAILQRLGPVAKMVQKIFEQGGKQGWTATIVKKTILEFIDMFKDQQIQHAFADIKEAVTGQEAHRVTLEEMAVGRAAGRAIGKGLDKTGVKGKIQKVQKGRQADTTDHEQPPKKKAKEKIAEDPLLQKQREENLKIAEPTERVQAGRKAIKDILGEEIDITKPQSDAIAAAHDVPMTGIDTNGKPTYSKQDLATKMQILTDKDVGFSQKQADALLRMGVCGIPPPPPPPVRPINKPSPSPIAPVQPTALRKPPPLPPPPPPRPTGTPTNAPAPSPVAPVQPTAPRTLPPLPPRPGNAPTNMPTASPQKLPKVKEAPPPPRRPTEAPATAPVSSNVPKTTPNVPLKPKIDVEPVSPILQKKPQPTEKIQRPDVKRPPERQDASAGLRKFQELTKQQASRLEAVKKEDIPLLREMNTLQTERNQLEAKQSFFRSYKQEISALNTKIADVNRKRGALRSEKEQLEYRQRINPVLEEYHSLTQNPAALAKWTARYGHLTPEQVKMDPYLQQKLTQLRNESAFTFSSYLHQNLQDDGKSQIAFDPYRFKSKTPNMNETIVDGWIKPGNGDHIATTRYREHLVLAPLHDGEGVSKDQWTLTYAYKDGDNYHGGSPMHGKTGDPRRGGINSQDRGRESTIQNIPHDQKMASIMEHAEEHSESITRDNHFVISVTMDEKQAREMSRYFQANPSMIRPFFLNGMQGMEYTHKPPPYEKTDAMPNLGIQFREFSPTVVAGDKLKLQEERVLK